jgi:EmrB/QacA subfamily drug resistance transporter
VTGPGMAGDARMAGHAGMAGDAEAADGAGAAGGAGGGAARRAERSAAVVQYALLAGPLLSMIDSSIVNVAAAPIARELHASLATVQWTVSGYLLALGTGLAGTAYLARRYGTVRVYRASLAAFTAASALCALAPGIGALIAFRAAQGLVAAPLVPLAMSMLLGKGGKARSISVAAGIMLFAAPALGPTVGGALIGAGGWRLIFAVNVPFGVFAVWAARRLRGESAGTVREKEDFDFPGLLLLGAGVTLVLLGTSQGGTGGWGSAACLAPLMAGVVLLAAYWRWAASRPRPALDLSLLREATPALSMGLCALAAVVTWTAVFLLPVFVQTVQGRSALAAGIAMAPQGIVTGLSTAVGQRGLLRRFTVRATVCAGFGCLGVASLLLLTVEAATPLWLIAVILAVRSASIGLVITPLLTALTGPLPPERMGDASTLFNVVERIAGSFGIGLLASLYGTVARSPAGPVDALHVTGIVIASVAAAGAAFALFLPSVRNTTLLAD